MGDAFRGFCPDLDPRAPGQTNIGIMLEQIRLIPVAVEGCLQILEAF